MLPTVLRIVHSSTLDVALPLYPISGFDVVPLS